MIKRFISILLSVLLFSVPVYAAADPPDGMAIIDATTRQAATGYTAPEFYPIDVQTKIDKGVALLIKTFEVGPDVSPDQLVEPGLAQNGVEYELRDIQRTVSPDLQEVKPASQDFIISSSSDKQEDILPLLPDSIAYAKDGFAGQLPLDESSIRTEVESTESYRYTVTDTREYRGLFRNDPYLIPKTIQSGGVALTLSDIKWSPGSDIDPNPISYSATAYYRGTASGSRPIGFTASARYSGEVVKSLPGNVIYTIVYAEKLVPLLDEPVSGVGWTLVLSALGAALFISVIGTAAMFALRRRSVPAYADETPDIPQKRMRIPNMLNELEDDEYEQD